MSDHSALKNDAKDQINGHEITCDPVAVLALIAEVEQLQGKKALCKLHERATCIQCMWPPREQPELESLRAEVEALRNPESKKTDCGHGHVYPSLSGYRARCGGPGLCAMCSRDAATKAMGMESQRVVPVKHECVKGYGHGGQWCGPDFDCWLDPRSKAEKNGHGKGCSCWECTQ